MIWLQEARGPFEELLALEAAEGAAAARARLEVLRQAYLGLREAGEERPLAELEAGGRIDRQIARSRGVWVLWMLRASLGSLDFSELQAPWPAGFDFWISTTGLPRYELRSATARAEGQGYPVTVRVGNALRAVRGAECEVRSPTTTHFALRTSHASVASPPAPVVIQTEEGARHTFPVSVPLGETVEVAYRVLTRPVQAAVDPEGELLQPDRGTVWQPVRGCPRSGRRRWGIF